MPPPITDRAEVLADTLFSLPARHTWVFMKGKSPSGTEIRPLGIFYDNSRASYPYCAPLQYVVTLVYDHRAHIRVFVRICQVRRPGTF